MKMKIFKYILLLAAFVAVSCGDDDYSVEYIDTEVKTSVTGTISPSRTKIAPTTQLEFTVTLDQTFTYDAEITVAITETCNSLGLLATDSSAVATLTAGSDTATGVITVPDLSNEDTVGGWVGLRGSRVQAVVGELQGEKIEIIPFSEDPVGFVVNALAPAEVAKVLMDEVANKMDVVVPDDQLSLAIGRRGQNVRLASQLTGWYIDILTEAEESEKRQEEIKTRSDRFIEALNIDDVIAHLLVAEGFVMVEDIVVTDIEELAEIQGFDSDIATEIRNRAVEFVDVENKRIESELARLKVTDDLRQFEYLSLPMMLKLAENEVVSLDDLAELDSEELMGLIGELGLDDEAEAGNIIMAARAHWFDDEPVDEDALESSSETDASEPSGQEA